MSVPTSLVDSSTQNAARVTKYGQLVTAPLDYSAPIEQNLSVIDTAFNFIEPLQNHDIVITDIIISADKSVSGTTPADVRIYTADAPDSITVISGIVSPQPLRGVTIALTGLNFIVGRGVWVNAKTDDNSVLATVAYYYIPIEETR